MGTVLLTTMGTGGDIVPFLALGHALVARGHDVTLVSHAYYASRAIQLGINFVELDSPKEYEQLIEATAGLVGRAFDFHYADGIAASYYTDLRRRTEFEAIQTRIKKGKTVVLGRHLMATASYFAAEQADTPFAWVLLYPSATSTLQIADHLYHRELLHKLNCERALFGLPAARSWIDWATSPQFSLGLWPEWFAPEAARLPGLVSTGFILDDQAEVGVMPSKVQEFLASGSPPVLITGGTGMMLRQDFYRVAARACQLGGWRALLVTKYPQLVPKHLPSTIKWADHLPFASTMLYTSAVIHHGGINTSARALASGIPQLVLAEGVDRPDNAFHLQQLGVAEYLLPPYWTPERVATSLSRIAQSHEVRQSAQSISNRISRVKAVADACAVIERIMYS